VPTPYLPKAQMSIRIVRLGSPRHDSEGIRIGTVRRPPRGVPKDRFRTDNWYDVWLPQLAPSAELVKRGQAALSLAEWQVFERDFKAEMRQPDNARLLAFLATLSHHTSFSLGCYCEEEARCHRSTLRTLLASHGAKLV
jgi:uncharacterized protein YeaO (DUF488 family)